MKILAFDSSGMVASVALTEDDILLGEYTTNHKKTHSQTLLPMLDELMKMLSMDVKDVDVLALANGPGSFTGLRIGAATVKGLSLALDKPVVAVPTLLGLAYNMWGSDHVICPLMDARRNQVYTGIYRYTDEEGITTVLDQTPLDIADIIDRVNKIGEPVVYLGDGTVPYVEQIKEKTKVDYTFAPAHMNRQSAGAVAVAAYELYKQGNVSNGDDFAPDYLRKSQAERESGR